MDIDMENATNAANKVLEERKRTHGSWREFSRVEQDMKELLRSSPAWSSMLFGQRSALEACVHKIARIVTGDPYFLDSWRDVAGYATRGFEITSAEPSATDVHQQTFKVKDGLPK